VLDWKEAGLHAGHLRQVIIAGRSGAADTETLLDAAQAAFAPDKAVIFIDPTDKASVEFWRSHNPQALAMVEGAGLQVTRTLPRMKFISHHAPK
jgi:hypothetical protein